MKKSIILLILIAIIASCKPALFNEKNLDGWTVYGTEKWYIEDGVLICENGPDEAFGYLKTNKNYKNFELNFEFKLSEKGNSGVFIHSNIDDNLKVDGWQIEIGPPGHFLGGIFKYDKGWLDKPNPEKDKLYKKKGWNKMKIVVKDNSITSWLNGHQMATFTDNTLADKAGGIALQIHGGHETKMEWRNIKLVE